MADEKKLRDYLGRVITELHDTRQRLRDAESGRQEPIAIVSMSCHLPGGIRTPEDLWQLLADGRDGVTSFPTDRGWNPDQLRHPDGDERGSARAAQGGFLHDAAMFDPGFFGINPREAVAMDPQQRLVLELAWEAVERAGIRPKTLRGTRTGVFVGANGQGYEALTQASPAGSEGYLLTGGATSVVSGRIAYTLGLEGPAVTVDSACSSSLTALYLAGQALRNDDCVMALVGGVTVMPHPIGFHEFNRQRGLSSDGRCKAFSAAADGMGMAEGAGMLLVTTLSYARRAGLSVLAVVRGGAVNQDGASNGLTAPSGPAQQRVIRQALANARLSPEQVDAVEAHGTGTTLGDPIEAQALLATYGQDRPADRPLWLGSLKSNIGHTQAAAGVASVIKAVLALRHRILPRTLHADEPSPHVDWSAGAVSLLTRSRPWEPVDGTRRIGISSFGISGTNAHLILEEAPQDVPGTATGPPAGSADVPVLPVLLSARSAVALRGQADRLAALVRADPAPGLLDLARSLATTRASFEHRAVLLAADRADLLDGLDALRDGSGRPGLRQAVTTPGPLAMLFTGQGAQRAGMGQRLYAAFPAYAAAFDAVCAHLDPHLDRPLRDVVFAEPGGPDADPLDQTRYAQAALFAVETALFRLLESWGIRPDLLLGHSIGEVVAAHVAGVLSLVDACALVAARGRLMQALPAGGAMLAVQATEAEAVESLTGAGLDTVGVAAVNGPDSVVLSGDRAAIDRLDAHWRERGRRVKALTVSHAFHSPLMEPMLADFGAAIGELTFEPPTVPIVSNVTGRLADPDTLRTPDYWVRQVRAAVRFADGVATLAGQGVTTYVEVGPGGVLTAMAEGCLTEPANLIPALREVGGEVPGLIRALADIHLHGGDPDWSAVFAAWGGTPIDLPTYAFQRQRYWPSAHPAGDVTAVGLTGADHPLLGAAVSLAGDDGVLLTGRLSAGTQPWLAGHVVLGSILLPGTAFVELALRAGEQVGCNRLEELTLRAPLALPADGGLQLQLRVGAADGNGRRTVNVFARTEGTDADWTRHAEGLLGPGVAVPAADTGAWPPAGAEPIAVDGWYGDAAGAGLDYGPVFQGLRAAWRYGDELLAEIALPGQAHGDAGGYGIHPALLDAALHPIGLGGLLPDDDSGIRLPFSWSGVTLHAAGSATLRVRLAAAGPESVRLTCTDETGAALVTVESLVLRPVRPVTGDAPTDALFGVGWVTADLPTVDATGWAVVGADAGDLADRIAAAGIPTTRLTSLADLAATAVPPMVLLPIEPVGSDLVARTRAATHQALAVLQTWLADERLADARLVLVTRDAVPAGGEPVDPAAAAVWGLVRAVQAENPGQLVLADLGAQTDADPAGLAAALATDEPQFAVRAGQVLLPRLARAGADPNTEMSTPDPTGTVLISGGTGVLGGLVARHLVTTYGVRHLLLLGRRGAQTAGVAELVADLATLGATAEVAACDVADRAALAAVLAGIDPARPLTGVVHAAGIVDDALIGSLTPERVDAVLAPKVAGAANLHDLTADADLAMFVLFSSASATLGGAGQGNYAAANGFLDGLAQLRTARGLPAVSVGWGLWAQASGITGQLSEAEWNRITRAGGAFTAPEALALFDLAVRGPAHLVAMRLELAALRGQVARHPQTPVPPLLRGLVHGRVRRAGGPAATVDAGRSALANRLAGLSEPEQQRELLDVIRAEAAAVLGHPSADLVEPQRAFTDLGFDSLTAVELRNQLGAVTGLRLPATMVFDHPYPAALARFLRPKLLGLAQPVTAPNVAGVGADEPIAIVGMSCRFPGGVDSPDALWQLVATGTDAITPFPANRGWATDDIYDPDPDRSGSSYVIEGGFVHDADTFDPSLFGISPRESLAMDPQQRMMLEASWEAFERAGIDPTSVKGSRTGVFAGLMYHDYAATMTVLPEGVEGYLGTGTAGSVLAGRTAYTFGLEGPAMVVDTACSSSLVALHLACQALRSGECDMALAGGVTVLSTPTVFIDFSRQRGLSRDGRCRSFAGSADGTGWSEGIGLLLVERLSDAVRNGHPVLAVVRGSAVNSDGASNGLTAPNGPSQERVIRQALASARLSTSDVDAVEAHGTGTTLGDPIEAQALLATYGQDRPVDQPLWLGSLKSNIGHSQAAAGVGGIIKMVQAIRHGVLPRTLHIDEPTPHVDWTAGSVSLLTESRPWPATGRPRRAGVSSFGVSGTNAHVVIEQAPAGPADPKQTPTAPERAPAEPAALPFLLSAKSAEALRAQAGRLHALVATEPGLDPLDVAVSLATTRATLEHRAVALAGDRDGLLDALSAVAAGGAHAGVASGVAGGTAGVAFIFPGQGSQWAGMAAGLLDESATFADRIDGCERALRPYVDWSLTDVLRATDGAPSLDRVDVVQPVLWAVMVSLAQLWRSAGVVPSAVAGHSQGEIAAAVVAGGLSLDDGARVVALRSQAIAEVLSGAGGMVSLAAGRDAVTELIARWGDALSVAAVNGPLSTVVSGDAGALDELLAACAERDLRARRIPVDYASHSAHVERIRDRLAEQLAPIRPTSAPVPFYSAVTGGPLDTAGLDATYWYDNLRRTVLFEAVTRRLLADGRSVLVEVSPHPVLTVGIQETIDATGAVGGAMRAVLGTLRRDEGGPRRWLTALAEAHVAGVPVDWTSVLGGRGGRIVDLPTYAFQRRRFWPEPGVPVGDVTAAGLDAADHPLLGAAVTVAGDGRVLVTGRLSITGQTWLAEHVVLGTMIVPGSAFVELALRAGAQVGCARLEELTLQTPLALPERGGVRLQVALDVPDPSGRREVTVYSSPETAGPGESWTTHATGVVTAEQPAEPFDLSNWPPPGAEPVGVEGFYAGAAAAGYGYGPTFRGLRGLWRHEGTVYAEVVLPEGTHGEAGRYGVHPALLDAALHAAGPGGLVPDTGEVRMPFAWSGVALYAVGATSLRVRLTPAGPGAIGIQVADPAGQPVAAVDSLTTRRVSDDEVRAAGSGVTDSLFHLDWVAPSAVTGTAAASSWAVVGRDTARIAEKLIEHVAEIDWHPDLDSLIEAVEDGMPVPQVVVWSGKATAQLRGGFADKARNEVTGMLLRLQTWLDDERLAGSTMLLLTSNAVAVSDTERPDLATAAARGLVRSAQGENPGRFVLVDIDDDPASVPRLLELPELDEPQVALRAGTLLVPRIAQAAVPAPAATGSAGTPAGLAGTEGRVLITGGTGTLGGLVARHLVTEFGVRQLLLVSRGGDMAAGAGELTAELTGLGAHVDVVACDVADRDQLQDLLDAYPVTGVVHAAGVIDDGVIGSLTLTRLQAVLRPKVDAAVNLHELTSDLGMFVLFSSAAAMSGSVGQGSYAAANAFLDALAQHRRAGGLAGVSIAWGLWAQATGMTRHMDATDLARATRAGAAMSDEEGLALFDTVLRAGQNLPAHLMASRLDVLALRARAGSAPVPPLLRGLVPSPIWRTASGGVDDEPTLANRLAGLSELEQKRMLLQLVRSDAAVVLGHAGADDIDPERGFTELGFSSLTAIEMRNRLAAATGLRLPTTLIFDHPTAVKLVDHLHGALALDAAVGPPPLIADLDRLEAGLASTGEQDDTRIRVLLRLRALLARYDGDAEPTGIADLDSATDEQMFALIDNELGAG